MANPQHFPRLQNDFEKLKKATLLVISWAIVTGGTPTAIQYPPETVRGVWGEDVLLQFAINGTQPQSSIVLQGPNPQTGSNNLQHIFERGTDELDPHRPFEDNFTVSIVWFEGVTFVNLTIRNLQNKVVGKYRLSMTVHYTGADINVYGWSSANFPSTTSTPHDTWPWAVSSYRSTDAVSGPGSTQGSGGLNGGYIALIVLAIAALLVSVAIIGLCFYKRRTSGARQQASQQGDYDRVIDRDHQDNGVPGTPKALELNDMNNHDREIGGDDGSPDSAHSNGPVAV